MYKTQHTCVWQYKQAWRAWLTVIVSPLPGPTVQRLKQCRMQQCRLQLSPQP